MPNPVENKIRKSFETDESQGLSEKTRLSETTPVTAEMPPPRLSIPSNTYPERRCP